jgi:precorrin-6A/cobalt-precorrin-6A reductase
MAEACPQTLRLHIFGGTSDALSLCRLLEAHGFSYSLSVATNVGEELAAMLKGDIIVGRMDERQMTQWLKDNGVDCVIDATHPFAAEVSRNVLQACQRLAIGCLRFERPQHIDTLDHPLLFKVDDVEQACTQAAQLGERIFLTTGSKQLADYVRLLPGKFLLARVLPTVAVLEACNALGLGVANIVALKGPFSTEINAAMYRFYQPDVVITKESGDAGGYRQKVQPCIDAGIPCIVIRRPQVDYVCVYSNLDALVARLLTLSNSEVKVK